MPGLLNLILKDLKSKESRGFGEFRIHRSLTKAQLDELKAAKKDLLNEKSFVETYLNRLLPNADESIAASPKVREAYLERVEKFTTGLSPVFNSLKAHILYQRLVHDRALGKESEERFLAYLKLPRNVGYLCPHWRKREPEVWRYRANLGEDFRKFTMFPPVGGGDEALVRSYLLKFLEGAKDRSKFEPYLDEKWLKRIFAEAKITGGVGKSSEWASLLSPVEFQELKDRVDIEFAPTNREFYGIEDEVSLKLDIKNVPKLMVKVFEVNTLNYYRTVGNEVSTDIDLDGLVSNFRETHEYDLAPQLKKSREFALSAIPKRRGIWVVEFIGGGKSSRAVIRKGGLGVVSKMHTKGQLLTVLNEEHEPLGQAAVWVGNDQFVCDDKGRVLLPFTARPGVRSVVVEDSQGYATMASLLRPAEEYEMTAGIFLEEESLRTGGKAQLIVRPNLSLNGEPISLKKVKSASLDLSSIDIEGVKASANIPDVKLSSDREFVHEFSVPARVNQLTATLRIRVELVSGGEVELKDSMTFDVNDTLKDDVVGDYYLSRVDSGYRVHFLGQNGEPIEGQNLSISLKNRYFKNTRDLTMKTTKSGEIDLGGLSNIELVKVRGANGKSREWQMIGDRRDQVDLFNVVEGQAFKVPYVGQLNREEVALFSGRGDRFVNDEYSKLKIKNGYLTAKLSVGDYRLFLKNSGQIVRVQVSQGKTSEGFVFGGGRMLELSKENPSHLGEVKIDGKSLEIDVEGLNPHTRVHVIGTRFLPGRDIFAHLGGSEYQELMTSKRRVLPSLYISGRNLGDELRYILERRYTEKFAGNLLSRPEILLNPWAVRDTESEREYLEEGDLFARKPVPGSPKAMRKRRRANAFGAESPKKGGSALSTSYEFLALDPVVLSNLAPQDGGKISVDLEAFGDRQHLHVVLIDSSGSTYRSVARSDAKTMVRDLRLMANALDPKSHHTEQGQVTLLKKGEKLKIADLLSSDIEIYDRLGSVYRYFLTLNQSETLREFGFVTRWPKLSDEEKRAKYSKYACHELNFFLSQKDPEFFKKVVVPHLAFKKDRTFMDDYLLGKPMGKYFRVYDYDRLNVLERILLAQTDPKRAKALEGDLSDRISLLKPDPQSDEKWFGSAVGAAQGFGGGYADKLNELAALEAKADDALSGRASLLGVRREMKPLEKAESEARRRLSRGAEKKAKRFFKKQVVSERYDPFDSDVELNEELKNRARFFYQALEATKEWAENNYYRIPQDQQNYELVNENRFWLDFAKHGVKKGFGSKYLGEATGNFTEMMLALSVLDLPFEGPEHKDEVKDGSLAFEAGGNVLFFHREVKKAEMAEKRPPLLVNQSFFQRNDRYRMEDGQRVDRFVVGEFIKGEVYGAQIVVTNPTSTNRRLDVLSQIPKGAIPLMSGRATASRPIVVKSYSTERSEITFYFPKSGEFTGYPVHVSQGGKVVAHADVADFKVVDEPTKKDESSWAWISQWGGEAEVLKYLQGANLHAIDLSKIGWRCRGSDEFFQKVLSILDVRGVYVRELQAYAVKHNNKEALSEFLSMEKDFLNRCGVALESDLISVDPIHRVRYEHLEYRPLINQRAHRLGGENRILNPAIRGQYIKFLNVLSQRKKMSSEDRLAVTYYLFLQDRISEAIAQLRKVDSDQLETKMQLDYFEAYAAFYEADLEKAEKLAKKYEKYPVDRWRLRFAEIDGQINEIRGGRPEVVEDGDREQKQNLAASLEPTFDLKVAGGKGTVDYRNLDQVRINYYEMDLEFLFSTNPFVSSGGDRFAIVQPNQSDVLELGGQKGVKTFSLPEKYQSKNVIVEVIGGGKRVSKAVYSNSLRADLSERMGLLTVSHQESGKALPKVYVKVYANTDEGVRFFKDGYTDLRGKFDYASVSSSGLSGVRKFSILVMSDDHGATVLEVTPPQR